MDGSARQMSTTVNRLSMPPLSQPLTPYSHQNGEPPNMGMQNNYSSLQRRPKPVNNVPGNSSTLPRNLHKGVTQQPHAAWNGHPGNGHVAAHGQNQFQYQPRIPMPLQPIMKYEQ